jgi:hypothetical protein
MSSSLVLAADNIIVRFAIVKRQRRLTEPKRYFVTGEIIALEFQHHRITLPLSELSWCGANCSFFGALTIGRNQSNICCRRGVWNFQLDSIPVVFLSGPTIVGVF